MFTRILVWLGIALFSTVHLPARSITERDRSHWAFQPIRRVEPPVARTASQHAIDRFIVSKLETNSLAPAAPATREQLIRRVTFGLIGLPPTPEEIEYFVNDSSADAYEKLIDRLLRSPHYGERWGRHWLDLARFAESDGFEHDAPRPHSWRYRDYVIASFNADKPYDRFIREQIAGDELFPESPEAIVATGFNLLGADMVDSADQVQRRRNTLNDMTDTAALVFLGQTLGCARCHSHKSEPITQRDYYRFQAFFASTSFERGLPVPTAAERAAHDAAVARYEAATQEQRQQVEALDAPHRKRLHDEKLAKLSEEAQLAHKTPKEKRTVEMENQIQETSDLLKVSDAEVVKAMSEENRAAHKKLMQDLKKIPKPAALPMAMGLKRSKPIKTFVLGRGDYNDPRDEVQPGVPEVLSNSVPSEIEFTSGSGRAALANWMASSNNPLSARVMVNRLWQHHFGRGIVPMPSEFGTRAELPTHPELIDWLASEFIAGGWSVKRMQKLILLSETYQQSSHASEAARERDPENKLFSRQNRVRLEGEVIRDSLLAMSGRLNKAAGGPSVYPPIPASITKTSKNWTPSPNSADHTRRSLYIFSRRNLRFPFLEVFDAPDNNLSCAMRGQSTIAPQALTLLNSEEVMASAKALAERVLKEAQSPDAQIQRVFPIILGRAPTAREERMTREFMASCAGRMGSTQGAVEELCRALFNVNAFVYVD